MWGAGGGAHHPSDKARGDMGRYGESRASRGKVASRPRLLVSFSLTTMTVNPVRVVWYC